MNKDMIGFLYCNMANSEGYTDSDEVADARRRVTDLFNIGGGEKDDAMNELEFALERQGFTRGFKTAVKLIAESLGGGVCCMVGGWRL